MRLAVTTYIYIRRSFEPQKYILQEGTTVTQFAFGQT